MLKQSKNALRERKEKLKLPNASAKKKKKKNIKVKARTFERRYCNKLPCVENNSAISMFPVCKQKQHRDGIRFHAHSITSAIVFLL